MRLSTRSASTFSRWSKLTKLAMVIAVSLGRDCCCRVPTASLNGRPRRNCHPPLAITPITPSRLLDTREGRRSSAGQGGSGGSHRTPGRRCRRSAGRRGCRCGAQCDGRRADRCVVHHRVTHRRSPANRVVAQHAAGEVVPNLVIAKLGDGGRVSLFNQFGETHLIADVMAWIPDGVVYGALTPERLLDTRIGQGAPTGAVGPGGTVVLHVAGHGGVPNVGAGSVVLNVTVTEPTAPSFITVWPNGDAKPGTSSLNMFPGQTRPNLVISKIGPDGKVGARPTSSAPPISLQTWSAGFPKVRATPASRRHACSTPASATCRSAETQPGDSTLGTTFPATPRLSPSTSRSPNPLHPRTSPSGQPASTNR